MKIDVHFTPLGLVAGDLAGRGVVVVDALRATTTIVTALAERTRAILAQRGDLVIVCGGRDKQFALEDGYTAGRLIKAIRKGIRKLVLNDAARATVALIDQFAGWQEALERSEAAQQLVDADLGEDVAFAARPDRFGVVPVYADRRIT